MEKIAFAYQDPLEGYHVSAFHLFNVVPHSMIRKPFIFHQRVLLVLSKKF